MKIQHKSKRATPPLPQVAELINRLLETPIDELHEVVGRIQTWKWPRSDLNAWTAVLNKFDAYLEEVIRDYDIDNLQTNVLTPLTKKTVCEILRFERLLLENSTNRKTFNSYDRLNSLLSTSDLDVLVLALNLLLRPAQQYSAQSAVLHALSISTPRLTSLAKRWPNLREYDITFADLVAEKGKAQVDALPDEAREVNFTFYRQETAGSAAAKEKERAAETDVFDAPPQTPSRKTGASAVAVAGPSSGAVNVHIDSKMIESKEPMDILSDAVETYSVPAAEKFELLTRIRAARALTQAHADERVKLVQVRLLATAIFGHTHVESQAQSSLFLSEPDLISHIAELLQLDQDVDQQIQSAAIAALDSLARYRNKIQDVLTSVNAGVNHGILMALLRKTVSEVAQPTSTLPQSYVEGLLAFVSFIATHASGGNMVVSAGLVPLLIQVIENKLPNRLYVVSKTMQLLDNVLYGFNNSFQLFCNARGVETLVERIEGEVDFDLSHPINEKSTDEVLVSYGKIPVARAAVLKHLLRSMHRMMQSSGTAEGLRGLLDSSLLKSVRKVLENRSVFGPSVLPIAINIMATFVHNEPTCLPVIQETGLPEAFYQVVDSGLEPVIEVIQAVPNAIGALCLNQAGQDQLAARPNTIPSLFSIFTSERHQRVLQDKENAVLIGTAVEELIRHHPSLKESVFGALKSTMAKMEELGGAFVPPEEIKHWYGLIPAVSSASAAPFAEQTAEADVAMEPTQPLEQPPLAPLAASLDEASTVRDDNHGRAHDNIIISYIDVFCKFLEGFFQHIPHCKDFLADPLSLEQFGRLTALPCFPYDFANSVASDSLVQVVRTMAEAATTETITFLVRLVSDSLNDNRDFWESMSEDSKLLSLVNVTDADLSDANARLRRLTTLHLRVSLLSDIYSTAGYSHGRATSALLQSLVGPSTPGLLPDLGALHRACIWENIALKSVLATQGIGSGLSASAIAQEGPGLSPFDTPTLSQREADVGSTGASNGAPGGTAAPTPAQQPKKKETRQERNANAAKHLASQIPSSLAPFFQAVVRLFQSRRTPDAAQKQKIRETATILGQVVLKHVEQRDFKDRLSVLAYYTVMIGLTTILLVDERASQKTLHTVLLSEFYRIGGMDAVFVLIRVFTQTVDEVTAIPQDDRSDIAKQELVHAFGGLKVALHLLHPIVSGKALLESAQTSMLVTADKKPADADYFEPHNFFVKLRTGIMPLLVDLWQSPWLVSAPLSVSKSVVQVVMEVLNTEGEEVKEAVGPSSLSNGALSFSRMTGPDENRIRQLMDMGFPRSAAERALIRTRNNISAATELLLAHPLPFPPDPEPEAAPVAPANAAEGTEPSSSESNTAAVEGASDLPPGPESPEAPEPTVEEPTTPAKAPEEWLAELKEARQPLLQDIGKQALKLVDEHPSLVFDVQRVFVGPSIQYRDESVRCLIDELEAFSPSAYDEHEQPIAVRCRLLALVLNDPTSPLTQLPEDEIKSLSDVLLALLLSNPVSAETNHPTVAKWLAAHLLVAEAILVGGDEPRAIVLPTEGEPVEQQAIRTGRRYPEARAILFDFSLRLLAIQTLPKDELISALRLIVLLTQERKMAEEFIRRDGLGLLFRYMKISAGTPSAAGTQSYVAIILRHIVEDATTLQHIMRNEIKRFFSHPRNHRLIEASMFVNGCNALAMREPDMFIQVVRDLCQLSQPYSAIKSLSLKPERAAVNESPETQKEDKMEVDEAAPVVAAHLPSEAVEAVVHFLISELMKTVRAESTSVSVGEQSKTQQEGGALTATQGESQARPEAADASNHRDDHVYACFLMQCLTELLFSYDLCKHAFLSFSQKKRNQTPAREGSAKHRTTAIQFLLSDLLSFGTINPVPGPDARKQIMICNCAMSVVVALCVDTSSSSDTKESSSELLSIRRFVMEAINRAVKDLPLTENAETRYSRLLALADLCYRLLTVRFNAGPRKASEESPTHIAKIMLEKSFVATLTNALADIDLNYPNVRGVVTAILRPLDYLSKIAMKMSRVSKVTVADEADLLDESDSEDEEEDHVDVETPDLYRNSSLSMFGGEMEDVHYGPDDDMEEHEDDEDEDVEMDYGEDTGSEDTSATEEDVGQEIADELEEASGESEEQGWQDEDEEDHEDLVENDDDDEEDEEGEDVEDGGVMWQDIAVGDDVGGNDAEEQDEEDDGADAVPIMHMDADEVEVASEEDEYGDGLGGLDPGPAVSDLFDLPAGFGMLADGLLNAADGHGQPMFWTGTMRSGRRRGVDDDLEVFGRSRNVPATTPDAVMHPLLVDPTSSGRGSASQSRTARRLQRSFTGDPQDLLQTIEDAIGEGAAQLFQQLNVSGALGEAIRIDVPPEAWAPLHRHGRHAISASIRLERAPHHTAGRSEARNFDPLLTVQRWLEEVKMLHGKFEQSRLTRLASHVVLALMPAAVEAAQQIKLLEEARERQRAEEAARQAAKEKEEEEKRQAERSAHEAAQGSTTDAQEQESSAVDVDAEMADASTEDATEDLEDTAVTAEPVAEPGPSAAPERITVMIHGSPVDITDTGIDPTFLEALPDDMREEVLNQHVREQRAARIERPADSQISSEFLDALPAEIRAEILQQESIERARQRTEQASVQPQAPTSAPAELDPASFIASLEPQLRQVVLMDSDDVFIQSLPSHMIAEAGIHRDNVRTTRTLLPPIPSQPQHASQKATAPRDVIQLLDKSGIAILVRLLFFPNVLKKNLLYKVMVNLCENTKTRTDLFNLLLSILQDGSGDLSAIDKSFSQMSFRNSRHASQQTPKSIGKQRTPSDYFGSLALPQNEVVPELIMQRCLEALTYIVSSNEVSSIFFLTEHELSLGLRRNASKKGKGKEKQAPQTHYPVVLLLGLLDRQSVLKTPSIVESVVALLATVTRPLASLKDQAKIQAKDKQAVESDSSDPAGANVSSEAVSPETVPPEPGAPAPGTAQASTDTKPEVRSITDEKVLLTSPPVIPHTVLRFVVNVLTAGECSGRTFVQSLSLIQHLSYISDTREVVANELRTRAQEFGQGLYTALDELALALQKSDGSALASSVASKFSPASSDQAKLLRVLKTIDYMYSRHGSAATPEGNEDVEKVQGMYESFRFTPLWRRLGDCLTVIEEKPEMEHIATVLLPLIESLMVVCKYVGSKTASTATSRLLRASASPRSPASTRESMEELFVSFTDTHRKVLNLMVRNNPSLMSGSFSLLVNNPRVLDFDNKRNYFNQQLHRRPATREHYGTLQLNVRRQRVFEDSFQYLQRKTGDQIKFGKLSVRFYDEEGVDAGGVTREWFQILARQMFDPNYALFQPCAADRLTYQPNKASWVNPEHLSFFKFVGRVIGKAIYDGRLLDAYFARSLYRQILGKPVDYRDVEWVDPEYYNSLCWILENDPSPLELTFSVEADEFGVTKVIDLKDDGRSIPVTQENKREFVQLSAQYRLYSSIKDQIEALVSGFYEIIPKDLISIFNEQELELLISGTPDIDVDEWRSATEYNGYTSSDPVIVWWWRALKSFNREERAKVLSFATGTSRVPLGGFTELQGVQGVQKFSIHRAYGDIDRLPQAHTCFNQIDLPQYSSYEMLRQQLLLAINEGGEGFGFA